MALISPRVIASAAKQSICPVRRHGLLRCARNDGVQFFRFNFQRAHTEIRHPEVRAPARLEGRRPVCGRFILRGLPKRLAPQDDGDTDSYSRDKLRPSFAKKFLALRKQRAQGRPGARCTRGLVCDSTNKNCTRAYRAAVNTRPSLRNGFTAYNVLSPENGSFASVAP